MSSVAAMVTMVTKKMVTMVTKKMVTTTKKKAETKKSFPLHPLYKRRKGERRKGERGTQERGAEGVGGVKVLFLYILTHLGLRRSERSSRRSWVLQASCGNLSEHDGGFSVALNGSKRKQTEINGSKRKQTENTSRRCRNFALSNRYMPAEGLSRSTF